jgi:hypothetical protein
MNDEKIDFVVITGAGASFPFGAPLMGQWCVELVKKLSTAPGYREVTRLATGLRPEDFEARLGEFLHRVQAFDQIEALIEPSLLLQPPPNPMFNADAVLNWHHTTQHHLRQVVEKIRESLYELFAGRNLSAVGAAAAYRHLFDAIGLDVRTSRWVYATTNYDVLAENVITQLGGRPDWGELPDVVGSTAERRLDVDYLIDSIPRSTPVLHLHGRVGWYRRPDGSVYATGTTKHNEGYGVPIVMLPDLNKVYGDDQVISSLWNQFENALSRAHRVFVLGHSLHDEPLIQAIHAHVEPWRVMVSVLANEDHPETVHDDAKSVMEVIDAHRWMHVPLRFGRGLEHTREAIFEWLRET